MKLWKDILGYEGIYKINDFGMVINSKGRMLRNRFHNGYLYIGLTKNKVKKSHPVHRLVAINFIPNPLNLNQINHLDEVKDNNSVSNLEWATARYNQNYSKNKRSTSKYSGVCFAKNRGKWQAQCQINSVVKFLGYFDCEIKAFKAYSYFCTLNNLK